MGAYPEAAPKNGRGRLKVTEIIDWTHAKQNLNKAFETLSKKKFRMVDFDRVLGQYHGNIKSLLNVKATQDHEKTQKLLRVEHRPHEYAASRAMSLPIGSGVIESASNMRVKVILELPKRNIPESPSMDGDRQLDQAVAQ